VLRDVWDSDERWRGSRGGIGEGPRFGVKAGEARDLGSGQSEGRERQAWWQVQVRRRVSRVRSARVG